MAPSDLLARSRAVHDMIRVGFTEGCIDMALLTARTAAERMGIGYSTLKQWIRLGKVRTTQTAGGHHRLAEAEVDRILAHHAPDAPAGARGGDRPAGLIVALSGRNQLRGFVEEVRIDGLLGQVRLRIGDQKKRTVSALKNLNYNVIAAGDSFNDTAMLMEANVGYLFRSPANVQKQFPVRRMELSLGRSSSSRQAVRGHEGPGFQKTKMRLLRAPLALIPCSTRSSPNQSPFRFGGLLVLRGGGRNRREINLAAVRNPANRVGPPRIKPSSPPQ
jgi:excisionase family DNA binding protein